MARAAGDGLICAFRLGAARGEDDTRRVGLAGEPRWLHFNLSDARTERWLAAQAQLPEEACELLVEREPRIRAEILPEGISLVLGDVHHDFRGEPEGLGVLRLYLDKDLLVTARTHPLRSVDILRRELERGNSFEGTFDLFERLLERMAETLGEVVASRGDEVDDAEDLILAARYKDQGHTLGKVRRLLLRLRRMLNANRASLSMLPERVEGLYGAEGKARIRQLIERFDAVAQDLDLVSERARLLQEEIAGRIGEVTNRNLFVLSIATTTLLPVTLITGIFGMNVNGLPFALHPHGFGFVMLAMAATLAASLILLKGMRLF